MNVQIVISPTPLYNFGHFYNDTRPFFLIFFIGILWSFIQFWKIGFPSFPLPLLFQKLGYHPRRKSERFLGHSYKLICPSIFSFGLLDEWGQKGLLHITRKGRVIGGFLGADHARVLCFFVAAHWCEWRRRPLWYIALPNLPTFHWIPF